MNISRDVWAWRDISFPEWRVEVNKRFVVRYGITIAEAGIDTERLTAHWEEKQSPYEFVEWFGNKYDLDPITIFDRHLRKR